MSLSSIKNLVTSKAALSVLQIKKSSPTILFVAGTVGIAATVYLACRATLKVEAVLEETENNLQAVADAEYHDENDRSRDKMFVYGKAVGSFAMLFGPPVVLGITSIAMLTGSHVILQRRNLAVTAAYAALDKGFKEYRGRVAAKYGEVEEKSLRYDLEDKEIIEETDKGPVVRTVKAPTKKSASIYARFFDEGNAHWKRHPGYNQLFIQCQQNYANDLLRARGHVFLNEIYDLLGLERTKEGQVVGWLLNNPDGDGYIDFGVFAVDPYQGQMFANGDEHNVLLDFNVDGVIFDKI